MSFMKEYENINDTIFDTEYNKDFQSRTKKPKTLWFNYLIEEQASELYNLEIFKKFQLELKETLSLQVLVLQQGKVYEVFVSPNSIQKEYRPRKHIVIVDLPNENYSCICGKFSKDGMLCSHVLKVMLDLNVRKIPEKYIIERWRKKERKETKKHIMQKENGDNSVLMFNVLSRKGADIASKASKRKRTYDYLVDELDKLEKNIDLMIQQEDQTQLSQHQGSGIEIANAEQQEQEKDVQEEHIEDPDTANTKGRKPKRYRRIVEKIIESSKKKIEEQEDTEENQNKARPKRKNNEEKQTANSATKGNAEN